MATIPYKVVRKENWDGEKYQLREVLDAIPFTATQRREIDYHISRMDDLFDETNNTLGVREEKDPD